MTNGWIAPVNFMHYWVTDAAVAEGTRVGTNRVSVLRRTEVKPGSRLVPLPAPGLNTPIDDRAILDYVVRFNVDFMLRTAANSNVVDYARATDAATILNPERVRGVIIDLVARTAEHEPEYFQLPKYSFKLFTTVGAARVRSAHAEVMMPNVAIRGL
jgi:hypothetical protein